MAFTGQLRSNKATAFVVGIVIFLAALVGLAYNHLDDWQPPNHKSSGGVDDTGSDIPSSGSDSGSSSGSSPSKDTGSKPKVSKPLSDLAELYLTQIRSPSIKPNTRTYNPFFGAERWELPDEESQWEEGLGEDFCIIDMDNRPFDEDGQVFSKKPMEWDNPKIHGLSLGVLNHYVYAKIHGYKYYYIDFETYEDRRASWKKPPIMSKILKKHKACVYLDSDAVFNQLELPFEWLMNYWSLHPDINSMALAFDPGSNNNKDKFGTVYLNTGFIVVQNNDKTFEIMEDWQKCADDGGKHPDCVDFRFARPGKPTDQGGFGTYIRYDYPKDIKSLPCDEANGFPESHSGCAGHFVKHLWTGKKNWIKQVVGDQIPGDLLPTFHKMFLEDAKDFRMTEDALMKTKDPK